MLYPYITLGDGTEVLHTQIIKENDGYQYRGASPAPARLREQGSDASIGVLNPAVGAKNDSEQAQSFVCPSNNQERKSVLIRLHEVPVYAGLHASVC